MKRLRIYISGRMSGLSKEEYKSLFEMAEQHLAAAGHEPVNPCSLDDMFETLGLSYSEILLRDLHILSRCDAIYLLDNWKDSKGARAEKAFAEATGKSIMYQSTVYEREKKIRGWNRS